MAARVNTKFLIALILIIATAGIAVAAVYSIQKRSNGARFARQGDEYMQQGDYASACRFYERLGRYRHEGHLAAYLFRIATNLVRSEERRRRRFRLLLPFLSAERSAPPKPSAELIADEEQSQVARALEALDLRFRAPLVLREIEGLSYGEIAATLELSEGTVKSRLHRARELLKKKLAPYWKGGRPCP